VVHLMIPIRMKQTVVVFWGKTKNYVTLYLYGIEHCLCFVNQNLMWCSFKRWWNFCPDLSRSKFHLKGERSIGYDISNVYAKAEPTWQERQVGVFHFLIIVGGPSFLQRDCSRSNDVTVIKVKVNKCAIQCYRSCTCSLQLFQRTVKCVKIYMYSLHHVTSIYSAG
jgi:hypothetical protein